MAQPTEFIGRDREQEEFRRWMTEACAGNGGVVLLGGEAGVGKSTLLRTSLLDGSPLLTVVGHCQGESETPTYGPWLEAVTELRRALSLDVEPLPPPFGIGEGEWRIADTAAALATALQRLERPVCVVLEDLQWADTASLELLQHMIWRLQKGSVLVVATYRTDEVNPRHPLWTVLPELERAGATRLVLDRLLPDEVAEWVKAALPDSRAITAIAAQLHQRTGGNPLFVREILAAAVRSGDLAGMEAPLPDTVHQAIGRRLSLLSTPTRQALQAAAVIGERFSYDLLFQVIGGEEEQLLTSLEEAVELRVIRSVGQSGDLFTFDHALVRQALMGGLIGPRLRRLHVAVAEAIQARPHPRLEEIAFHLDRARDPRAAETMMAAGDEALRLQAPVQASSHYQRALELMDPDDPRRAEVLLKTGRCLQMGDLKRASALWEEAVGLAKSPAVEVWCRYSLAEAMWWLGDPRFAEWAERVRADQIRLLDDPEYQRLEVALFGSVSGVPTIIGLLAQYLGAAGRMDEALDLLDQAKARTMTDAGRHGICGITGWLYHLSGRLEEAVALMQERGELALRLRRYRAAAFAEVHHLAVLLLCRMDRPEEVDAVADHVARLEAEAQERTGQSVLIGNVSGLTPYWFLRGEWDRAEAQFREWFSQQLHNYELVGWRYHAVTLYLARGDLERARWVVAGAPPRSPEEDPPQGIAGQPVFGHIAHALVQLAEGQTEEAATWLQAAERWVRLRRLMPDRSILPLTWAQVHRQAGRNAEAQVAAEKALALAEEQHVMQNIAAARRLLGELAAEQGDLERADEHLRASLSVAERCRIPYVRALAQLARARWTPLLPGVREGLLAARETFQRLGAKSAAEAAERLLNEGGTEHPSEPVGRGAALPDGLTEREVDVIRLVARGLTDREIGAHLFISHRTVDSHLRNIFNKAGVSTRAALVVYATRNNLV